MVLTSGNVSEEPIAYRDDDAFTRLGAIADFFLTHDRPIHVRTDDSVVRVTRDRETAGTACARLRATADSLAVEIAASTSSRAAAS